MAFAARLCRDNRGAERYSIKVDATLRDADRLPADVVVHDLSTSGFRIATAIRLPIGAEITLGIAGLGVQSATVVRMDGDWYGCAFDSIVSQNALVSAFDSVTSTPIPFTKPQDQPSASSIDEDADRYPAGWRITMFVTLPIAAWFAAAAAVRAIL